MSSWVETVVAVTAAISGVAGVGALLWRFTRRLFLALDALQELEEIKTELQSIKAEAAATRRNTEATNGRLAEALTRLAVVESRVADHIHEDRGGVRLTRDNRPPRTR